MNAMTRERARDCARWLAYGRIAIGVAALVVPPRLARPWVGPHADLPAARVLSRALGGRDLALGLGVLLALRHDGPARGWVEAGGLADTGDLVATLLSFRALPTRGRWAVAAAAAGAAATARLAAPSVD